ncbi:hypothetical protein EBZ39_12895, partial [bacterium]|nr:hypothetical protein [bacterium]
MANEKIRNIAAPNLPVAPVEYQQRFMDQLTNVLRLFFTSVTNNVNAPKPYGTFYDTNTQTNPVANAVNLMKITSTYNSDIGQFSVSRDTTRITVSETGIYNIQFSAQLDKTGGAASAVYIWLRRNGQNLANSATKVVIDGPNSEMVAAWNWVISMNTGDYVEIAWQSSDTNVILAAAAASGNIPEIPSVIITVTWVSNPAPT